MRFKSPCARFIIIVIRVTPPTSYHLSSEYQQLLEQRVRRINDPTRRGVSG
jgi:hypothetical protein